MLTLDEAIKHCQEKADCSECGKEHKQLAEWLIELKQLKENPPLKFEDLKEGMWVWDNKYKEYCYIYFIAGVYPHRKYIDNCESDGAFEENRFYLKEVKE